MKNKEIETLVAEAIRKLQEWQNLIALDGNQTAFSDRVLEEGILKCNQLETLYESQFEKGKKKTFFIAFESFGSEELIVKTESEDLEDAFETAEQAFLNDRIDRYEIEKSELNKYDCRIISENGDELNLLDEMENIKEEKN